MLKQRPPTAAHVELLYREKEITIKALPGARSKLAGRHKDYLKEYEILDAQNANALWYAHFHYKDLSVLRRATPPRTLKPRRSGVWAASLNRPAAATSATALRCTAVR
jgi:hypothetical protein